MTSQDKLAKRCAPFLPAASQIRHVFIAQSAPNFVFFLITYLTGSRCPGSTTAAWRSPRTPSTCWTAASEAAALLPTLLKDLATWVDIDAIAWGQRYAVVTACRSLYALHTAEVASKRGSLEWALRTLQSRWRPLLAQVHDERVLGWDQDRAARVGEADAARAFVTYAVANANGTDALEGIA